MSLQIRTRHEPADIDWGLQDLERLIILAESPIRVCTSAYYIPNLFNVPGLNGKLLQCVGNWHASFGYRLGSTHRTRRWLPRSASTRVIGSRSPVRDGEP
jgi:hypothetical protein